MTIAVATALIIAVSIAVSTVSPTRRTNFTWLPFRLISAKPARSNRRLISRKGSGLSRPNVNLDDPYRRWACGQRWLEVQFQRLFEVRQRFLFGLALAGNVYLKALGNEPVTFPPDRRGKRSLHRFIVPQEGGGLAFPGPAQAGGAVRFREARVPLTAPCQAGQVAHRSGDLRRDQH